MDSAGHESIGWPLDEPAYFGPAESNLVQIALNVNIWAEYVIIGQSHLVLCSPVSSENVNGVRA